jgi:hypothetical protein
MKPKRIKKLLRKYIAWWVHWTGLGYWDIGVTFEDMCEENLDRCGISHVNWEYLTANLTFYIKPLRRVSPATIELAVVHELMHVLLNEMRENGIDHEERCATQLQKAFVWVKGAK